MFNTLHIFATMIHINKLHVYLDCSFSVVSCPTVRWQVLCLQDTQLLVMYSALANKNVSCIKHLKGAFAIEMQTKYQHPSCQQSFPSFSSR